MSSRLSFDTFATASLPLTSKCHCDSSSGTCTALFLQLQLYTNTYYLGTRTLDGHMSRQQLLWNTGEWTMCYPVTRALPCGGPVALVPVGLVRHVVVRRSGSHDVRAWGPGPGVAEAHLSVAPHYCFRPSAHHSSAPTLVSIFSSIDSQAATARLDYFRSLLLVMAFPGALIRSRRRSLDTH
jgi:hypothetical protein